MGKQTYIIMVPGHLIYYYDIIAYFSDLGYNVLQMEAKSGNFSSGKLLPGSKWEIMLEDPDEDQLLFDLLSGKFLNIEEKSGS